MGFRGATLPVLFWCSCTRGHTGGFSLHVFCLNPMDPRAPGEVCHTSSFPGAHCWSHTSFHTENKALIHCVGVLSTLGMASQCRGFLLCSVAAGMGRLGGWDVYGFTRNLSHYPRFCHGKNGKMLMHWRPLGIPRARAPPGRFPFHSPSHFFPSEAGFSLFQVCSWYFLGCQDFLGTGS